MAANLGDTGRVLLSIGILLAIAGCALILSGRLGIPLGRLPGDIVYRGKRASVFFPLGTSLLLSIVLSLVFYLISRSRN